MNIAAKPLVIVPVCNRDIGAHPFHVVGRKYTDAARAVGLLPLLIPNASEGEIQDLLSEVDGVLLTGSSSNVHPSRFGQEVRDPGLPLDEARDRTTAALISAAMGIGMPILAICRGLQELNVALGGTLHQALHQVTPHSDHRADPNASTDDQYGPAHQVHVVPGGVLDALLDEKRFDVNSLHGQAVSDLGEGLRIEARAPDGAVEAVSVSNHRGFALGVQWHPEWRAEEKAVSMRILKAFGRACQAYRHSRLRRPV